ncbi:MAG TPA: EamA/RhaT family transporter [Candidatus Atribacteria bacterium]|nr:EamA/RhaT family transporter [Candidatus Atribacteria bacterium]
MPIKTKPGTFLLILTALMWSTGGVLIKSISWHPLAIAGTRSAIAFLIFLFYLRRPRFTWSLPQIGGALSYAGTVALFVAATKLTTAASAILLQYSAPIYVALLSGPVLNEKTTRRDWWIICTVFGGMLLFFFDKLEGSNLLGNLLAIASGWAFALLAIFLRLQKDGSPFESVLLGNLLTALIGLPFMFRGFPFDPKSITALLLLGTFQIGLSYILYVKAVQMVTALAACLIPIIEPILNPLWVFLVIGETPGKWSLLGGALVICGVTWWSLKSKENLSEP